MRVRACSVCSVCSVRSVPVNEKQHGRAEDAQRQVLEDHQERARHVLAAALLFPAPRARRRARRQRESAQLAEQQQQRQQGEHEPGLGTQVALGLGHTWGRAPGPKASPAPVGHGP